MMIRENETYGSQSAAIKDELIRGVLWADWKEKEIIFFQINNSLTNFFNHNLEKARVQ
jgi:hypothetical protein